MAKVKEEVLEEIGISMNTNMNIYTWNKDSLLMSMGVDEDGYDVKCVEYDLKDFKWFIDNRDKIFVDKKAQRKLKKWKPSQNLGYYSSMLKGTAVTQFILVDLYSVKEGCELELEDNTLTSTQRENVTETLDWCDKWIGEGYLYHLSDGQHRNDFIKRYFYTSKKEGGYIPKFKSDDVVPINAGKTAIKPTELNKPFSDLDWGIQEMIENIDIPVCFIKSPNMGLIMETFTSVNSGTPLNPIELLTNMWTSVSKWLRGLEDNVMVDTFFFNNLYKKAKDIEDRETLKKVLQSLCYVCESNGTNPYRQGIDKKETWGDAVSPTSHIDKNLLSDVEDVLEDLGEGLSLNYNTTTENVYRLTTYNSKTSSMLMLILTYMISKRDMDVFYDDSKLGKYKLQLDNKSEWVEWLADTIIDLALSEQYAYLTDKNEKTLIPQFDSDGNERFLIGDDGEAEEHPDGYYRKLTQGRSLKNNLQYLIDGLVDRFENEIDTLIGNRVFKKLPLQRTLTSRNKVNAYQRKRKSNLSGKKINPQDVLNGKRINATHNIGDAYADGGEEMGLGEEPLNKKMGKI